MTLASLALVCGVIAQKANTNAPSDGVSASAPMMSAARGAPETNLQSPTNAPQTFPLYFPRPIPKPAHAMRTSWAARWCLCADCVRAGL